MPLGGNGSQMWNRIGSELQLGAYGGVSAPLPNWIWGTNGLLLPITRTISRNLPRVDINLLDESPNGQNALLSWQKKATLATLHRCYEVPPWVMNAAEENVKMTLTCQDWFKPSLPLVTLSLWNVPEKHMARGGLTLSLSDTISLCFVVVRLFPLGNFLVFTFSFAAVFRLMKTTWAGCIFFSYRRDKEISKICTSFPSKGTLRDIIAPVSGLFSWILLWKFITRWLQ